ncbi:hypothetical protein IMG5_122980 [Ichthyophthirius multifiliis]|uniref:DNA polymerase n=1 Tax=Ichthyophthirius multifiliis TaxID=5932 RepID=G0QVD7_ICHMU|nr:hypothetical protein IMG5_122980 [Ichthyophthirius multifiliis]EGR30826.1 hypothetical protein IMG5_122980 [Ichthyophthirius multifiliis]|eukprot:XP_004032413.1 hypothetical protein IMG5_122980 [Ichthyophthirius multifiliis]
MIKNIENLDKKSRLAQLNKQVQKDIQKREKKKKQLINDDSYENDEVQEEQENDFIDDQYEIAQSNNVQKNDKKNDISEDEGTNSIQQFEEYLSKISKNLQEEKQKNTIISQPTDINYFKNAEDGSLDVYLYDYYYDNVVKPGKIYAFGKVKDPQLNKYHSCTIEIENIIRYYYLLPSSEQITEEEIKNEVHQIFKNAQKMSKKVDFVGQFVQKNYAFELPIPKGNQKWYQIMTSYEFESLDPDVKGKTFNYCIGSTYSSLESFLIQKRIKGPCWVKMRNIKNTPNLISNRKLEFKIDYSINTNIQVLEGQKNSPVFSVVSLGLKSVNRIDLKGNKKEYKKEIFILTMKFNQNVNIDNSIVKEMQNYQKIAFVCHPNNQKKQDSVFQKGVLDKQTVFCQSEMVLLENFLNKFNELDPDIVVGHDLYQTLLDIICNRIKERGLQKWVYLSKLINVGSNEIPKYGNAMQKCRQILKGRLIVDTLLSCQEFLNSVEYTIEHLAKKIFDKEITRVDQKDYEKKFATNFLVNSIVEDTYLDNEYALKIMYHLQIIQLTKQLTIICGNQWIGSLQNQRAERNEMLLLHKFYELNYVYPDNFKNLNFQYKKKMQLKLSENTGSQQQQGKQKKQKFKGGQVFEPQKGLYNEYIVLLDFNSLYPSIIQEFNVCFTTATRKSLSLEQQMQIFIKNKKDLNEQIIQNNQEEEEQYNDIQQDQQNDDQIAQIEKVKYIAVLPGILRDLVDQRKKVKNQLKNAKDQLEKETLDIKQKAFKLVANSIYGCLGFSSSRFYAMPIAAFITSKGREVLFSSKKIVEDMGYNVIYGDTDSLMIRPNTQDLCEAIKIALKIKIEANKQYKKLQLDIDGVFKNMLLIKKKKYATLKVCNWEEAYQNKNIQEITVKELKGIDIVRRDWSQISRDAGNKVLDIILNSKSSEQVQENIITYLTELNKEIDEKRIKPSDYYITKKLTKRIDQYGEKNIPHVEVASRMITEKGLDPQSLVGHIINYIICKNQSSKLIDKAFSPKEYNDQKDTLEIDLEYYKKYQIFEPIKRQLEVIENINISQVASIFAIKYTVVQTKENIEEQGHQNKDMRRIYLQKYMPQVNLICKSCKKSQLFTGCFKYESENSDSQQNEKQKNILQCKFCQEDNFINIRNGVIFCLKNLIRYKQQMELVDENEIDSFTFGFSLLKNYELRITNKFFNDQLQALQSMFELSIQEKNELSVDIQLKIQNIKQIVDKELEKSDYFNVPVLQFMNSFGIQ